jgi:hypothetical protein
MLWMRVEYLDITLLLPLWELPEGCELRWVLHPLDHLSHKDKLKGDHLQIFRFFVLCIVIAICA